ncbi:MAG: hypothetical protein R2809_10700 [Flavobacteriales bacterium]
MLRSFKKSFDLPAASEQLERDRKLIKEYLLSQGVNEKDMVFSAVSIDKKTMIATAENN